MNRKTVNRGKQLKLAREFRGYTQSSLCKKIKGLSQSNLSKFEKGLDGQLSESKQKEIMKFFDWPFEWLDVKHPEIYIFS